jgi:16S rRNA G966 N2-methylase RsmD
MLLKELFGNFDIKSIVNNPDFKEDSVREVILMPILLKLGFDNNSIERSKSLSHPYIKIGSKKRYINLIPDYLLKVQNNYVWVLDAKSPSEKIINSDNIEQVYSYSSHPEIRTNYFALCNGIEFAVYRTSSTNEPILFFPIDEIEYYWERLLKLLSPNSFQYGKPFIYEKHDFTSVIRNDEDYLKRPLLKEIPVRKQAAKRHFGVHGYFTKQSWNVVAEYIKNFSKPGDLVLDPFGGSGVTAIEAMMNNRKAISIDLNPLAVFIVQSLIAPVDQSELMSSFEKIKKEYLKKEPKTDNEINEALKKYKYPTGFILPKGSNVKVVEDLFTKKQLAQLALLKFLLKKEKNVNIKKSLFLSFSSSINKFNLTFHYTKSEGGGDSGIYRYYRYRIAPNPGILDLIDIFETKFKRLLAAKKDIEYSINSNTISNCKIIKGTATDLRWLDKESIDYIYTDPPYGDKIPYLDLSVMWNAWLDLEVTQEDKNLEAIEDGEMNKTKEEYNKLIAKSIEEMYRVLKFNRWMSFVFAHKDPEFWHLIIDTAERCGFEYAGAVPQKNGQTSFKKRQHPFTVLSGQLIINFKKVKNPKSIMKANLGMGIAEIVMQTIEGIIAKENAATLEQINDELIIKGLELCFLDLLKKEYSDLTPFLLDNFAYNETKEVFTIKPNARFKTNIDVKLRIRYYLISYLRRIQIEDKSAHFDEIVLNILPLLKNGITPEHQTISSVLEDIAERVAQDSWVLKKDGQGNLFNYF